MYLFFPRALWALSGLAVCAGTLQAQTLPTLREAVESAWTLSPPSSLAPSQTKTATVSFQPGAPGSYAASARPVRTTDFFGTGAVACTPLSSVMLSGANP